MATNRIAWTWSTPDNPDGTRCPGDDGQRFATPEEAGKFVAEWLRENARK
jgi:hypothetical protein